MNEVERKLTAARTRLILDKPFLGALVLRLPLKEAEGNWCQSAATDARSLYYNAGYIESLSFSQVQFVLAHEAMHCGLSHFARRDYREINRWNIACDHAVNLLLLEDGLEPVPEALCNEAYKGLAAEEIYPLIQKDSNEEPHDQHLYDQDGSDDSSQQNNDEHDRQNNNQNKGQNNGQSDGRGDGRGDGQGDGQNTIPPDTDQRENIEPPSQQGSSGSLPPDPLSAHERDQSHTLWQQRLASAAQQASLAGKMNGSVARFIDRLLRSTVPWRTILARYMSGSSRIDYNLMRPSHRREGDAILPSLHSRQTNVVIAVDTSGSIQQEELDAFIGEINAIKSLVNARITLLACDWQLDKDGPWIFESWEYLEFPKTLQGGGGTEFTPVFDWMAEHNVQPDLVVYFTDANGRFPAKPPVTETLWLVKGPTPVPWGQRIQLN